MQAAAFDPRFGGRGGRSGEQKFGCTGGAEMVKRFKILVRCFSARVSRSAGICT